MLSQLTSSRLHPVIFSQQSSVGRFFALVVFQSILWLALSVAGANSRLAIGTFGLSSNKRDGDLADLIATRLSSAPGIELVERRELNAALHEASLSLSGVVRSNGAIRIGALLRADQFLLGSSAPINGTNRVIVRLVDARTGVIRAINVFTDASSLDTLAENISGFARAEIQRPSQAHQDYLAIGVIQNLGINNRFSDFPAQMRASIAANLNGKATVLERDVISFLANEVRLDMAGLTTNTGSSQIQFGFWIVDGFYQSYEIAEPEVELKLRMERVQGGQQSLVLQGKPNELFFSKICGAITNVLNNNMATPGSPVPTKQGEIAALEARGKQLVDYNPTMNVLTRTLRLRAAQNPDKIMNTLDEATRVFESILLLDPDNVPAKMKLAACLLFETEQWGGVRRGNLEERKARAKELYRDVIPAGDPTFAVDARILLADTCGGLEGVEMLRRFSNETENPESKKRLRYYSSDMLRALEYDLPVEKTFPDLRAQVFDELKDVEVNSKNGVLVSFEDALFAYRFYAKKREQVINKLLPDLLEHFADLNPYILLAAASEQTDPRSPVITAFLESLNQCQQHPEILLDQTNYFTHLSATLKDESGGRAGWLIANPFQKAFNNHLYNLVITLALARQQAAGKGLAPPLTPLDNWRVTDSYKALGQWQQAFDIVNELPDATAKDKNECRRHLGLTIESEEIPETIWKTQTDINKVVLAYQCIGNQLWSNAVAILDSMGHRTVRMNHGGAWGGAFAPVLPAVVADECRTKGGMPAVKDPMRFDLGDPYVGFTRGALRKFSFEVENEADLWIGTYSEVKRFSGPGPFAASNAVELHSFPRVTQKANTCICISPDFIWNGSVDEGIAELDRKTGIFRRYTMKDGLLVNGISHLYLQGQTLWIAYQNGDNGGVGTMDLRTRKFSTLTPKLRADAGTSSQPYYDQKYLDSFRDAPQHPVTSLMEGERGEMWFSVEEKGLQHYRNTDSKWDTIAGTFAYDDYLSSIALDVPHGQVLVGTREKDVLSGEKSGSGGLVVYDYRNDKHYKFGIHHGLPSNDLTAVAVDGRIAWVGGRGFIAVLDMQSKTTLRIAYLSANCISKIQLGKTFAWIQVSAGGGDSYPEYSGTAWTGVYRIDRAEIEPSFNTLSLR